MAEGLGGGHEVIEADRNPRDALILAGGVAFFGLFFILPLGYFYFRAPSLAPGGDPAARAWEILSAGRTWRIVGFATMQAAASALLCIVVALPGALLSARYSFRGKNLFRSASLLPFVLPSIIVVIAVISFYGKNGLLNRLLGTEFNLIYNPFGIVLAHLFYNVSLALRILSDGFLLVDSRLRETAACLGEKKSGVFFRVTLPLAAPAVVTAFALIFLYCFLSFGVVLVFGGASYSTLEVEIYGAMFVKLDPLAASAYSLLQLVLAGSVLAASSRLIGALKHDAPKPPKRVEPPLASERFSKRSAGCVYLLFFGIFLFGPLATMAVRAFTPNGTWTAASFVELFRPETSSRDVEGLIRSTVPGVVGRSLLYAAGSGGATFLLAFALAFALKGRKRLRGLETFFLLPAGMSLMSLGLGIGLLFGDYLPPGLLVLVCQVLLAFPFVYRILRSTLEDFHKSYEEVGRSLGLKGFGLFRRVRFPLMKRGLLNGFAYGMAISFADFTAVMAVGRGEIATFPVAIFRLIGFRSYDLGLALGMIYIGLCLGVFFLLDKTSLETESNS